MEILFMVFMSIVSVVALFAVLIVLRDIVTELVASRRESNKTKRDIVEYAEKIIADAEAKAKEAAATPAPIVVSEPTPEVIEEPAPAPVVEQTSEPEPEPEIEAEPEVEEPVEAPAEGTISFSTGNQKTIDEKYLELTSEARGWYDEIIKYASAVEGSKRFKNARYEEYKVGKNRLVRLLIKRDVINCEFILHNSDFKNYVNENKISVKQSATTMLVETEATVEAVKNSIDIVVAAIAEEKEYKKQLAREKRRAARAEAREAEENATV